MKQQERAIRRSLARWIKTQLSMAYNKWVDWYEHVIAERVALRRALSKWAQDGLLQAFTLWRNGKSISQHDLHVRAASFWLNGQMASAWKQWRHVYENSRELWWIIQKIEQRHAAERTELEEEIARLRRLLGDRAYATPIQFDEDEAKMARALKMWQNQALAKGFNRLKFEMEKARRARALARQSLGHWIHRLLSQGFNSWLMWYEDLLHQRATVNNAVQRWCKQRIFAAFNRWRDVLTAGLRRKNAMLRAVLRWGGSELFAAFGYWRETAEKIRVAELEFRAYLTKSYDPAERSKSRSRTSSPTRQRMSMAADDENVEDAEDF